MAMELVPVMVKQPGTCFVCGTTPYDGKNPKEAIDLNRDYDWGNNAYICSECGHLIATLLDYPDIDKIKKLLKKVKSQEETIEELETKIKKQDEQLDRIRDGSKAVKEVRAA